MGTVEPKMSEILGGKLNGMEILVGNFKKIWVNFE